AQAARAVFYTLRMVKSLDDLSRHRYSALFEAVDRIDALVKEEVGKRKELPVSEFILPYSSIYKEMVDWVGGKNANLGELHNKLGLDVPEGFAITTNSYDFFLQRNDLIEEIHRTKMDLDPSDPEVLNSVSETIQRLIMSSPVPEELSEAIVSAYDSIREKIRQDRGNPEDFTFPVALRSSAIGEDSELSFAGQYLSVLNVPREKLVESYKLVIASLFTSRAISYRINKGMRVEDMAMSVGCLEMVESVASGVMYSRNPIDPLHDRVLINAVWGLGPYAVDGIITPDSYVVQKDAELTIVSVKVSNKPVKLVSNPAGGLLELPVEQDKREKPCLTDEQIRTLASYA
ncbi:MAG: PEP/pyruvate-binding domain-containing protein, partial [Deltaproteobacteria bacterium]|nr:PEP/pyruvate-binding domain-containing protein [Deltaproteobacteria bacterium]